MSTGTVRIDCTGTKKRPHPGKPALIAVFSRCEDTDGNVWWEVVPAVTRDYQAAWDEAGKDPTMAGFDALGDHPGRPRDAVTEHLVGHVPVPDDMESVEASAWWHKQTMRARFALYCQRCGADQKVTGERLFPILTTANPEGYGESRLTLSEVIASM